MTTTKRSDGSELHFEEFPERADIKVSKALTTSKGDKIGVVVTTGRSVILAAVGKHDGDTVTVIGSPDVGATELLGEISDGVKGVVSRAKVVFLCMALSLLAGCASETLFRSNFDQTAAGQPPSATQAIGTAAIDGPPGSVTVIDPPVLPSGKWVQISRPTGPSTAGFQGKFSQFRGEGVYTFSATLFMPQDAGVATVQFEPNTNGPSDLSAFLHLDFMPDNQVRIDDNDNAKFGSFPRGQPFIVQVKLNIKPVGSTANIVLSGSGASGERTVTILTPFQNMSLQFGAIRGWQGFPHTGAFDATNIAVTRKTE